MSNTPTYAIGDRVLFRGPFDEVRTGTVYQVVVAEDRDDPIDLAVNIDGRDRSRWVRSREAQPLRLLLVADGFGAVTIDEDGDQTAIPVYPGAYPILGYEPADPDVGLWADDLIIDVHGEEVHVFDSAGQNVTVIGAGHSIQSKDYARLVEASWDREDCSC